MSSSEHDDALEIRALILTILVHFDDPIDSGVLAVHCERFAERSERELASGKLDRGNVMRNLAILEQEAVVSVVDLETLVQDFGVDTDAIGDTLLGSAEVVALGRMFPHFLAVNSALVRDVATAVGIEIDDVLIDQSSDQLAPASDRIVSLGDNSKVRDAEIAVGQALRNISESNTLDPVSKNRIRSALDLGLSLLKAPQTYAIAISGLLLKPLYDAYASVVEEVSKPIIKAAIDAVLALFG